MRKIQAIAVVVLVLAAGSARADQQSGLSLGLRAGYGIAMGDAASGASLSDYFSGEVPLQVDAMYRFDKNWSVGLYFQYGFAFISDTICPTGFGVSCSGTDTRLGAQAHYRFDGQGFFPWVGLGIGYEWSSISGSGGGVSADILTLDGFEYLNLQIGGDWLLSPNFRLGPYVQFTLAQYENAESPVLGISGSIADTAMHEWLQFGVKGTFDL
jgi:outer membrane protein W